MSGKEPTKNELAYQKLVELYGQAGVARLAGVSRQALAKWDAVPFTRVQQIVSNSGMKPEKIRPEPYAVP